MKSDLTDLSGWWHTKWGMTQAEIVESLHDAKLVRVSRLDFKDTYADYKVEDALIETFKFEVILQMCKKNDRLKRVVMRHLLPIGEPQDKQVKSLFNALVRDFGAPEMGDGPNEFVWIFPTTKVQMLAVNNAGINIITVGFEAR